MTEIKKKRKSRAAGITLRQLYKVRGRKDELILTAKLKKYTISRLTMKFIEGNQDIRDYIGPWWNNQGENKTCCEIAKDLKLLIPITGKRVKELIAEQKTIKQRRRSARYGHYLYKNENKQRLYPLVKLYDCIDHLYRGNCY